MEAPVKYNDMICFGLYDHEAVPLCSLYHDGHTNLHSYKQCIRGPRFQHPHEHFPSRLVFLVVAILPGLRFYFIMSYSPSDCICLMVNDAQYLCVCLLATRASFEKCLFSMFAYSL